ncbi:olfactory receptor 1E5-like [Bufo bufo]|uniref:olfactory receptor 1E5-like n=1 Tax=Bufo bufo TaxID=8384 RepID=UPI001ABE34CB|nr:olfactory receptor 1E5-like [Bufo bufo]
MLLKNHTFGDNFYILPFFLHAEKKSLISIGFVLIYIFGLMWNGAIIMVFTMNSHLHIPMYLFLCNLSLVDMCYTTVTVPKLLEILLSGNNMISLLQCLAQMYFFALMISAEVTMLTIMAYDRYIAICIPLHYHHIMSRRNCLWILILAWVSAIFNSVFLTSFASTTAWCQPKNIENFYCDVKALAKISCSELRFQAIIFIDTLLLGFLPFTISLLSYVKILGVILSIASMEGRKKAFSTCSSHFIVLLFFYGAGVCVYIRPPTQYWEEPEQVFSILYTIVTPTLNPLIYSLRNKDVKDALIKLIRLKSK